MNEAKRKKKSYYIQSKRTCGGRQHLEADLKGFLITCGNKSEKQAVREAYNILNEYADMMYGEVLKTGPTEVTTEAGEIDFDKAIADQVTAEKPGREDGIRRFQSLDTKTSNCIFVRTTIAHPDHVAAKFLSDVATTGVTKSRFILKIFPVLGTCRAAEDKIEKLVEEILRQRFDGGPLGTYAILYKVRCNSLGREQILPVVGRAVQTACSGSRVDLGNPDITISIDVLGKFCCVSVMKDFNRLKKYNIQELGKQTALVAVSGTGGGNASEESGENKTETSGDVADIKHKIKASEEFGPNKTDISSDVIAIKQEVLGGGNVLSGSPTEPAELCLPMPAADVDKFMVGENCDCDTVLGRIV